MRNKKHLKMYKAEKLIPRPEHGLPLHVKLIATINSVDFFKMTQIQAATNPPMVVNQQKRIRRSCGSVWKNEIGAVDIQKKSCRGVQIHCLGGTSITCPQCIKGFIKKIDLQRHEAVHSECI